MPIDFSQTKFTGNDQAYFEATTAGFLEDVGYSPEAIAAIKGYPPLALGLNEFLKRGGKIEKNQSTDLDPDTKISHKYLSEGDRIVMGTLGFDTEGQYEAVVLLAHELTHALTESGRNFSSDIEYLKKFDSAQDFAQETNLMEAEALYAEFITLRQMYPSVTLHVRSAWKNNEASTNLYPVSRDLDVIFGDVPPFNPAGQSVPPLTKKMHEALAKINTVLAYGILVTAAETEAERKGSDCTLTYDEMAKIVWLFEMTDIALDYFEALGENMFGNKAEAIKQIITSTSHMYNFKVLVNQAHNGKDSGTNYFGGDGVDNLQAEDFGSYLAMNKTDNYNEVLWGGGDKDNLRGSTFGGNDILLGGAGDDHLYGNGGDDRLAGNKDNDHLYGGEGDDHLYGGEGNDGLYGGKDNDTYYFDFSNPRTLTQQGVDTVIDDHGQNKLVLKIVNGLTITLSGGSLLNEKANNIYVDRKNSNIIYVYDEANKMLSMFYAGMPFAVINNFNKNTSEALFGLTFKDEVFNAGAEHTATFTLNKNFYNQVYLYPTKTAAATSTPYGASSELVGPVNVDVTTGIREDVVRGSEKGEIIRLGGGHNYVVGGAGHDTIYGGA